MVPWIHTDHGTAQVFRRVFGREIVEVIHNLGIDNMARNKSTSYVLQPYCETQKSDKQGVDNDFWILLELIAEWKETKCPIGYNLEKTV